MHDEEIGSWWTPEKYSSEIIQRSNRYSGPVVTDDEVRAARTRHRLALDRFK